MLSASQMYMTKTTVTVGKGGVMRFTIEITNPKEGGFMPDEHMIYQCITSPVQINGYIINITREEE